MHGIGMKMMVGHIGAKGSRTLSGYFCIFYEMSSKNFFGDNHKEDVIFKKERTKERI